MSIKYEAYTWSGKKVKGVVDTDSEEAAYELLQRDELIPYRLLPVRPRAVGRSVRPEPVSTEEPARRGLHQRGLLFAQVGHCFASSAGGAARPGSAVSG